MLQEMPDRPGDRLVAVRGGRWRVLDVVSHEDCEAWRLAGAGGSTRDAKATLLAPFDRPVAIARDGRPRRVSRRRWVAALRALLASTWGHGELRAAAAASIDLLPYQLEPVLASVHGATRMLIADEVGLGKTIQAGLIISELVTRGEGDRVLVLAPAGLCGQWRRELEDRFHLAATVVDAGELQQLARWSSLDAGPWQRVRLAIASVDFVKRQEVLRGMSPACYDLLVVDEAHACARARDRAAAIGWLARRSRRVVLLTATPHDGDPSGFQSLCGVGRLGDEGPLLMFRRTRSALGSPVARRVHLLRVAQRPAEHALHAALDRYTRRVWRARAGDHQGRSARLAMIVLRKRAASGATALMLSVSRRLEWLSDAGGEAARQILLPLAQGADLEEDDEQPGALLSAPGLDDTAAERRALRRLLELARAAAGLDGKASVLARLLGRLREPAIVFTEYRDTLDRLAARLECFGPLAVLHGGMDARDRDAAVRTFNEGTARVLLATDAAAHGLNLQSRCRVVINVELPWNPVRLEQRIGRVDRIGQQRRVHAVHLVAHGTCEDTVLARLASRIERARHCLGSPESLLGPHGEEQVAEAVFNGRHIDVGSPVTGETITAEAATALARREAERLERVRSLVRGPGPHGHTSPRQRRLKALLADLDRRAPWYTVLPGRRPLGLVPGLWCVCRTSVADGRGATRDETLLALLASRADARNGEADTAPVDPAALISACRPAVEGMARSAAAPRVAEARAAMAESACALRAREVAMAAADREPPSPVQPGLFDRRALADAERLASRRERAALETATRLAGLQRAGEIAAWRAEVLLVLVVPG